MAQTDKIRKLPGVTKSVEAALLGLGNLRGVNRKIGVKQVIVALSAFHKTLDKNGEVRSAKPAKVAKTSAKAPAKVAVKAKPPVKKAAPAATERRRGRPKGSTNKPKVQNGNGAEYHDSQPEMSAADMTLPPGLDAPSI